MKEGRRGPKRVTIVDSGLRSLGGHNYSYTTAVRDALCAQGAEVDVLANRAFPAGAAAGFRRVFTFGAYDFPPGQGLLRDLAHIRRQSRVHAGELEAALKGEGASPHLVFCHTAGDFELQAWASHVTRRPFPASLVIVQRLTPGFRRAGRLRPMLHPYWRLKPAALARLRRGLGRRFALATDSEALSHDYRAIFAGEILTLPIPVHPAVAALPPPAGRPIHLGFMGDTRRAKGFFRLPDLVEELFRTDAGVRAIVQGPPPASGPATDDSASAITRLQELTTQHPGRLQLVLEALSPDRYVDLLGRMDVVLLPYQHPTYREATSGIFAEALASGRPVVVSSGTWMEAELARAGGGTVFDPDRPGDFLRAAREVIARFEDHAARAGSTRGRWAAFHNPSTLAGMLLQRLDLREAS